MEKGPGLEVSMWDDGHVLTAFSIASDFLWEPQHGAHLAVDCHIPVLENVCIKMCKSTILNIGFPFILYYIFGSSSSAILTTLRAEERDGDRNINSAGASADILPTAFDTSTFAYLITLPVSLRTSNKVHNPNILCAHSPPLCATI